MQALRFASEGGVGVSSFWRHYPPNLIEPPPTRKRKFKDDDGKLAALMGKYSATATRRGTGRRRSPRG